MSDEHLTAFVGVWSRSDMKAPGGRLKVFYAVLTSTADEAEQLILEKVGLPNADVQILDETLAETAVDRKKLRPREAVELSSGV